MRLHTDKVTPEDLTDAARAANVGLERSTRHGSRSRNHAFDVVLSGSGNSGGRYGQFYFKAATWDEWGIFLAHLYRVDPEMIAGPYKHNHEDEYESFDFLTGDRYSDLRPADQHKRHKWRPTFNTPTNRNLTYCFVPNTVRSYSEFECRCGAVMRQVLDYIGADGQPTRKRPAHMMGAAS